MPWPGGRSDVIRALLRIFNIPDAPGTAHANIALQQRLQILDPEDRIHDLQNRGYQSIHWRLLSFEEQLLFLAGVAYHRNLHP